MHALCAKPAHELCRLLSSGDVSSEEVTRAHLDHIEAADGKIRAFTVVLRDEAMAAARRADEERRRGEARGPLHGLPVSVKESLDFAGQAATLGVSRRKSIIAAEDAGITELFRRAGCVILGRTNLSQIMMFHESRNPLFGQTSNPWSLAHTPGGSSGGESAAIAAGMSPLGVGGDIGGSIRVPAHFAGIAGIKPTLDRWTNKGANTAMVGQEVIRSQHGPMARTARDLALVMGALDPREMSALDPRVPPLPPPDPTRVDLSKLRAGFYLDDGVLPVSAAVARAVREAVEALRARGVEVVEFTPPGVPDMVYEYLGAMTADGGETALSWIDKDPIDPTLASMRALARVPAAVRRSAAAVAKMAGQERLGRFLAAVGQKSVAGLWATTGAMRSTRSAILAKMAAERVSFLICPAHATPALPHGMSKDFTLAGSPAMLWNVMQFPAGTVPVTRVRADETTRENPRDLLEKRAAEVDRQSEGLPVGVQVVARPWEEDVVLAAMMAIEDGVSDKPGFPKTPVAF